MNPKLSSLQPYPFQKLAALFEGIEPERDLSPIRLSIGEPKHATPGFILDAVAENLGGLAAYPTTLGSEPLRLAIAGWIERRYELPGIDPASQVIPVSGTREALFAFAQCVIDSTRPDPLVVSPNPFYQIYEGAAYLAGARPLFIETIADNGFAMDFSRLDKAQWERVQLVYVCTPGNPTGAVMDLAAWQTLFELSDRHDFIIAADECYSEIYRDDAAKPVGGLQAARHFGRDDFRRLVIFSSLSKRSNVPGMRSGFVAGDAAVLKRFLHYRTYHGCTMSPAFQAASIAAWNDETHVAENRRLYREKFERVTPLIAPWLACEAPQAGFYLWARTPRPDPEFARGLQAAYNVTVLPGSYLGREVDGLNPGAGYVRIALVASVDECLEAAGRIASYCQEL